MYRWISIVLVFALAGCVRFQPKPISSSKAVSDFEARTLNDEALRRFLETNHIASEWPRRSWDLNSLTMAAFYFNPELDVARAKWHGAGAAVLTAGERPN